MISHSWFVFFFQAEDGIRDVAVTGVQTCALPIWFETSSALERFESTKRRSTKERSPVGPARTSATVWAVLWFPPLPATSPRSEPLKVQPWAETGFPSGAKSIP